MKIVDNYEKVRETWRLKFLEMDHEELIRRFQLRADDQALYLTYFCREFRIDRTSGEISGPDPDEELTFNTVITIYNLFHYSIKNPAASGNLIPFREVKRAYPFEQAYRNTILKGFEKSFAGNVQALRDACEKLGGKRLKQGDAGYEIPAFPFLNIALYFWDGDEEFPAQANMLFDSNITDFMHEENVVGIASDALYYLTKAADMSALNVYGE